MQKKYKNLFDCEVGCNHKGDFKIATDFINVAQNFCKLDYIKFQNVIHDRLSRKEYSLIQIQKLMDTIMVYIEKN